MCVILMLSFTDVPVKVEDVVIVVIIQEDHFVNVVKKIIIEKMMRNNVNLVTVILLVPSPYSATRMDGVIVKKG